MSFVRNLTVRRKILFTVLFPTGNKETNKIYFTKYPKQATKSSLLFGMGQHLYNLRKNRF